MGEEGEERSRRAGKEGGGEENGRERKESEKERRYYEGEEREEGETRGERSMKKTANGDTEPKQLRKTTKR